MANNPVNLMNPAQQAAQPAPDLPRPDEAVPDSLPNLNPEPEAGAANKVVPTGGDLKQLSKAVDSDGDGIPDEKDKVNNVKEDRRYTLSVDDIMDKDGNVNTEELKAAIEKYKKYHKSSDNIPKALLNLGLFIGLAKNFFGAHHKRLQEETESLSAFEKPFQKLFNLPSNLAAKKFDNKISNNQMQLMYDAIPAFLLNSAHNRYERLNKGPIGTAVTAVTKPLRLVLDSTMKFFASFKFIALAIDMIENADPEHNPHPNHELSHMANDIAETGLKFLPFARSITDLNSYFGNTKGNLSQLVNGLGGSVINAMRFKDNWNSFVDKLTEKGVSATREEELNIDNTNSGEYISEDRREESLNTGGVAVAVKESIATDEERELEEEKHEIYEEKFVLTEKLHKLTSFLDLSPEMKDKVDGFMDKALGFLSGTKFNSKEREEKDDRKLQAISKIFRSISYLGDNRGEGVRDLGNGFVRLAQRAMNIVLDLPAISMVTIRSLGLFHKVRKDEDISEQDLKSLEDSLKLKAVGIAAEQLLLNTVKRGIGKMHVEFGGVVKSLNDIQWWKSKVDDVQGKLDKFSIPGTGAIFSIFRKISDNSFRNKAMTELRNNLPDDLVDTSSRLIKV